MIVNNIPTELSFESHPQISEKKSTGQQIMDKVFYKHKTNKKMINNVLNEIEEIKKRNLENEINYLDFLIISDEEYQKSLEEIDTIVDDLSEEDVTDILSIQKLISVYKHIFEIFSYLIGEAYFEWRLFKEKLNLHEVKLRMSNINYASFNQRMINCFLNKISKNKKFSEEFVRRNQGGISKFFRWVKAVLKIYIYKAQQKIKKNSENENGNNNINHANNSHVSMFSSNAISRLSKTEILEKKFHEEKIVKLKLRSDDDSLSSVYEINTRNSSENNNNSKSSNNVFFTGVENPTQILKSDRNSLNIQNTKRKKNEKNENFTNFTNLKKKENKSPLPIVPDIKPKLMQLEFDYTKEKDKKESKTLDSLPFLQFKTFHQLRSYYEILKQEKDNINNKHFKDLEAISKKNQINTGNMINILARNRLKVLDDDTLNMYMNCIKEEDEVIKCRWKK
jgi:hypothetical protein